MGVSKQPIKIAQGLVEIRNDGCHIIHDGISGVDQKFQGPDVCRGLLQQVVPGETEGETVNKTIPGDMELRQILEITSGLVCSTCSKPLMLVPNLPYGT